MQLLDYISQDENLKNFLQKTAKKSASVDTSASQSSSNLTKDDLKQVSNFVVHSGSFITTAVKMETVNWMYLMVRVPYLLAHTGHV